MGPDIARTRRSARGTTATPSTLCAKALDRRSDPVRQRATPAPIWDQLLGGGWVSDLYVSTPAVGTQSLAADEPHGSSRAGVIGGAEQRPSKPLRPMIHRLDRHRDGRLDLSLAERSRLHKDHYRAFEVGLCAPANRDLYPPDPILVVWRAASWLRLRDLQPWLRLRDLQPIRLAAGVRRRCSPCRRQGALDYGR